MDYRQYYPSNGNSDHIWETEIDIENLEKTRQKAFEEHNKSPRLETDPVDRDFAMNLLIFATAADVMPRPMSREPEPPKWPCRENHE